MLNDEYIIFDNNCEDISQKTDIRLFIQKKKKQT